MSNYVITANNIAELGGAQHVAHTLARGLASRGHTVYLVGITPVVDPHTYPNGGYAERTLMPQIWPEKTSANGDLRTNLRAQAVTELQSLLRSLGSANIVATQLWSLEIVLDALGDPNPHFPVIGQYHGSFAAAASGRDLRRAEKLAPQCTYFTALSGEDTAAFAQAGLTNVITLNNPTTITVEQFTEATAQVRGNTIDYIGRLSAEKGPDLLLSAWQQLQASDQVEGITLRFTGSGPMREELVARGVANAEFADPVDNAAHVIGQSRLVVLPSRTEGAPLVLAEALTLGTPVVVTDVSSGIREMIAGQSRAVLVERDSVEALAAGIAAGIAMESDPHPVYSQDDRVFEALEGLFLVPAGR
ncbi:MAG: glycosyltransferase [Candidatus Nanopelagicales bacterium]|nr:glycosyltransferase [Candidatus Nanopelagicales bacterium]MCF8539717.1 glycosyltransferase [Candidatus Nanopelagicales bacterium]MCF8550642.1 glycosyltransferase [Candidatus Nanopelagicales bacterium]